MSDTSGLLAFQPIAAEELDKQEQINWQTEAGGIISGAKGPINFHVDARVFVRDGPRALVAPDGESFDTQDEDITGSVGYSSFSRYRGNLAWELPFGRLTVARDVLHWGPGLFSNLIFNQNSIPFHRLTFSTKLGPLTVTTLYGDLGIGESRSLGGEKSLYGRRYEWALTPDLLLGISEQLILVGSGKPLLFAPIFPLFMAKSVLHEDENNGNIAFDAALRVQKRALLYSEFLIDDMESPSSLVIRDYRQNKWGWLIGVHGTTNLGDFDLGLVTEYSLIRPWVYTHFKDSPAQSTNFGRPLGNPDGPNSERMISRLYARTTNFYFGMEISWLWKGSAQGSDVFDEYDGERHLEPSDFSDQGSSTLTFTPMIHYSWAPFTSEASVTMGKNDVSVNLRGAVAW